MSEVSEIFDVSTSFLLSQRPGRNFGILRQIFVSKISEVSEVSTWPIIDVNYSEIYGTGNHNGNYKTCTLGKLNFLATYFGGFLTKNFAGTYFRGLVKQT